MFDDVMKIPFQIDTIPVLDKLTNHVGPHLTMLLLPSKRHVKALIQ